MKYLYIRNVILYLSRSVKALRNCSFIKAGGSLIFVLLMSMLLLVSHISANAQCTDPTKCDFDSDGITNSLDIDKDNDGQQDANKRNTCR